MRGIHTTFPTFRIIILLATSSMETTWTQGGEKDYTESILRLLCHMQLLNHQQLQPLKPRLFKETGVGSGMIFTNTFLGFRMRDRMMNSMPR